jgi:hypothetical protein
MDSIQCIISYGVLGHRSQRWEDTDFRLTQSPELFVDVCHKRPIADSIVVGTKRKGGKKALE